MEFLKRKPNKTEIFIIIVGLFCGCLVVSNIIAAKVLIFGDIILPGSIIIYPIVFIVGDILTEIYGFKLARKTIILALIVNFFAVVAFQLILILPGTNQGMSNGFNTVFQTTPRILLACFCSFFTGSYINAYVMEFLKEKFSRYLFVRCVVSTFLGELFDSIIFLSVAFVGVESISILITMVICQVTFKVLYEIIAYPLTNHAIKWIKSLDEGQLYY